MVRFVHLRKPSGKTPAFCQNSFDEAFAKLSIRLNNKNKELMENITKEENRFYAHIRKDDGTRELVEEHLIRTSELTAEYMKDFGLEQFGRIVGFCHDLGKCTKKFQEILARREIKVNHAIPGASILAVNYKKLIKDPHLRQIAYSIIAGHHAGLTSECVRGQVYYGKDSYIIDVLENAKKILSCDTIGKEIIKDGKHNALATQEELSYMYKLIDNAGITPELSAISRPDESHISEMLRYRIFLSCLVDADYTATNEFEENEVFTHKTIDYDKMLENLSKYRQRYPEPVPGTINDLRNRVYEAATNAGKSAEPQIYKMTAPTGTAKTLAMIKFGLECAKKNGQKRIFVVLPYLSIIKQNVDIYKEIFGDDIVLEDDSTIYSDSKDKDKNKIILHTEKWDAPIIITTNVKFCETLFAAKTSTLRKAHQVVNSVIIFDEAHTLPSEFINVTIRTLQELTKYNTTILLSTATQPDYTHRDNMKDCSFEEIIPDVQTLYDDYHALHNLECICIKEEVDYNILIDMTKDFNQCLYIFNTTSKARNMFDELVKEKEERDVFLLYTLLANSHRDAIIKEVQQRLQNNKPCYLVTTQCVEAGVDIDFPAVCREYAPLTSVVQALGRCNRNAKTDGTVILFSLHNVGKSGYPTITYRNESELTKEKVLTYQKISAKVNFDDLKFLNSYYKFLFEKHGYEADDNEKINRALEYFDFGEVEEEYKLIKEKSQVTIIVPYEEEMNTYKEVCKLAYNRNYFINKEIMKKSHKISVSLYADSKGVDEILKSCTQLKEGTWDPVPINWYIMQIGSYDKKKGVVPMEGGLYF